VVTDSEQRLTALSRNVDIPEKIPTMPTTATTLAASAAPPHPAQAPAPQSSGQANPQPAQPSQIPPRAPPLQAAIPQAVTRSASDPATDELLLRVWNNFTGYLSSLPNVFADEHVVSSVTTAYNAPSKSGVHDSDLDSTIDSTIDSIFRLKRVSSDGKTADLIESLEIKYVNNHAAAKNQSLTGPAIFNRGV
jgi:hypothetical protein